MSKKFPNRFNIYKNCRSVYFFTKQRNGLYKIVNKVKNGYNKFVNYGKICYIKRENIDNFIMRNINTSVNSLGIKVTCQKCYRKNRNISKR
jgi:hypothetical protein